MMKTNTVETIIQSFREGQNIFRRSSVELLIREISRLQKELAEGESNSLLRSAYQISLRNGESTNWEAFRSCVYKELVREHELLVKDVQDESILP